MSPTADRVTTGLRATRDRQLPRVTKRAEQLAFRATYRRLPPPLWSDWTGYEAIIRQLRKFSVADVPGDALEIGAFLGGGSVKLCAYFDKYAPDKHVFVVDVFDADFDSTETVDGRSMRALYADSLRGQNQKQLFDQVTNGWDNLRVVHGDSAAVEIPTSQLCFAMIDGNHDAAYVRSDFSMAWSRLSPGGVIALHDYGHDLPEVTHTINALVGEHANEVGRFWTIGMIAFIRKEPADLGSALNVRPL